MGIMDELENKAYDISKKHRRISPALLMRTLQVNGDMAFKLCCKVWMRQHLEAREWCRKMAM
jgi:hypothetical protein